MGKKHKDRQRKFMERNGILGELNLSVNDIFMIHTILEKCCYSYNREQLSLYTCQNINNTFTPISIDQWPTLAEKFRRLTNHLKEQEKLRLGISSGKVSTPPPASEQAQTKQDLMDNDEVNYCG